MARSQSTSSGATAIGMVLAFIALLLTIPVVAALSIPALGPPLIAAYCLWALISALRTAAPERVAAVALAALALVCSAFLPLSCGFGGLLVHDRRSHCDRRSCSSTHDVQRATSCSVLRGRAYRARNSMGRRGRRCLLQDRRQANCRALGSRRRRQREAAIERAKAGLALLPVRVITARRARSNGWSRPGVKRK